MKFWLFLIWSTECAGKANFGQLMISLSNETEAPLDTVTSVTN